MITRRLFFQSVAIAIMGLAFPEEQEPPQLTLANSAGAKVCVDFVKVLDFLIDYGIMFMQSKEGKNNG